MQSLVLGLLAALLWGLHDFAIRKVGPRADAAALYLIVLAAGAAWLAPVAGLTGGWGSVTPQVLWLSLGAGAAAATAGYAQFRAFTIGPVRLVAPICGAYPLLSVAFAMARGAQISGWVWLGALAVVGGIAVVARGEHGAGTGHARAAMGWAGLACVSFAATFGLLQWAAEQGADLPVSLIARLAACGLILAWVLRYRIDLKPAFKVWPVLIVMGALDVTALTAVTMAAGFAQPEFASVASSIFGIVTILLAWRFLREPMTRAQWLGVGVVFSGIVVLGFV